MYYSSL